MDPLVKQAFPNCVRHSYQEIISFQSPEKYMWFGKNSIDSEILQQYAKYERIALKMMDRLDSGGAFSFEERRMAYYRWLAYSMNVVKELNPQLVIFTEIPHHAPQYILYAVCQIQGIPILMFKPIYSFVSRLLTYHSVEDDPVLNYRQRELNEEISIETYSQIDSYINRLRGEYAQAKPTYSKALDKSNSLPYVIKKAAIKLFKKIVNLQTTNEPKNILKQKNKMLRDSNLTTRQLYWYSFKGGLYKRKLKKEYMKYVSPVDLNEKYVLVTLNYQPERTTSPDGGDYVDQWLMVSMIVKCLPRDWLIYVKEHGVQFHPKLDGHLGRSIDSYINLTDLPSVRLVGLEYSTFDLIDSASVVAVVNGNTGLEALARQKPVWVFGEGCWFKSCPGVRMITDIKSLKLAFEALNFESAPTVANLRKFLADFYGASHNIKLATSYAAEVDRVKNLRMVSDLFENEHKRLFPLANLVN
ncbi:MAG: hypothetical protein JJ862_00710 [Roseivirga sp.]|uniref:capsular polysaccharide export protein, LipB/KpsS family n=1 Tax=Roseivirga sp. TaxID=1964215 RepID=UPI001B0CC122|nr:hypothetical protein [Roseivirga sp.]MBO6660482.1 hypothetical protein [Roseivirga sp.]MBO6906781.1 hypothetical protein [Roseivirga sp.]